MIFKSATRNLTVTVSDDPLVTNAKEVVYLMKKIEELIQ